MGRYEQSEVESFTRSVLDDGYCILRGQFPAHALDVRITPAVLLTPVEHLCKARPHGFASQIKPAHPDPK